jgi:hypothetical protein
MPPPADHAAVVHGVNKGEVIGVIQVQLGKICRENLENSFHEHFLGFLDLLYRYSIHRLPDCLTGDVLRLELKMIGEACVSGPFRKGTLAAGINHPMNDRKQQDPAPAQTLQFPWLKASGEDLFNAKQTSCIEHGNLRTMFIGLECQAFGKGFVSRSKVVIPCRKLDEILHGADILEDMLPWRFFRAGTPALDEIIVNALFLYRFSFS